MLMRTCNAVALHPDCAPLLSGPQNTEQTLMTLLQLLRCMCEAHQLARASARSTGVPSRKQPFDEYCAASQGSRTTNSLKFNLLFILQVARLYACRYLDIWRRARTGARYLARPAEASHQSMAPSHPQLDEPSTERIEMEYFRFVRESSEPILLAKAPATLCASGTPTFGSPRLCLGAAVHVYTKNTCTYR